MKGIKGIVLGVTSLVAIAPQMGIIALVQAATGIKIPKWVAIILLGLDTAAAIVACLATFGVAIPAAVAKVAAGATTVTA